MDSSALDLATKTLAAAIDSLMTMGSPFLPIVLVQRGGERQLQRIVADRVEEAAAHARQIAAAQTDADASAFAVDAAIPYNGARFDAIVVEAWNFRTNRGARIGLRYEMKGVLRKKPSLIGSPLHLGKSGWYDPEDGEPAAVPTFPEVARATQPVQPEPPAQAASGFGPPPASATLAPAGIAPPPPSSVFEVPPLPRSFREEAVAAPAPAAPPVVSEPPAPAPSAPAPDVGPPPAIAPVALDPPVSHASSGLDFPPPTLAPEPVVEAPVVPVHPAAPAVERPVPTYVPQPIQRSDTPLGNRAMFAGIMELATKGRSFPAFAIVQKDGAWEQVTMTDASLADAAASVRAYARSRTDAEFIAFAVDSFVTVGDTEVEAVIVEVWEHATRVSFSVAQRYIPTGMPPSPRLTGRPLMRTRDGWVDVPSSMMLGGQLQFAYNDPAGA